MVVLFCKKVTAVVGNIPLLNMLILTVKSCFVKDQEVLASIL